MSVAPTRMRPDDLLGLALSALRQQKLRTALTVLGVAIGTFALIETVVFVVLLTVALAYVWRRGALEWK